MMSENRTLDCTMEVAVQPEHSISAAEMERFLIEMAVQDLGCNAVLSSDTVIIRGDDERRLDQAIASLQDSVRGTLRVGAPHVRHRQTVKTATLIDQTHTTPYKKPGQHAGLKIAVEPLSPGSGCRVQNAIQDDSLPSGLLAELETSMHDLFRNAGPGGIAMTGVKITVLDLAYTGLRPSADDLRQAARTAFAEAISKAGTLLLEPVATVEICTPDDDMPSVLADLFQRRIWLQGRPRERDGWTTISAHVPVGNMFGYANTLAQMTQGRGTFRMEPSHYQRVPRRPEENMQPAAPAVAAVGA